MREHPSEPGTLPAEQSRVAEPVAGALALEGPTVRQELLLRRQHLWTEGLTQQQASELIEEFLTRKHAERLLGQRGDSICDPIQSTA